MSFSVNFYRYSFSLFCAWYKYISNVLLAIDNIRPACLWNVNNKISYKRWFQHHSVCDMVPLKTLYFCIFSLWPNQAQNPDNFLPFPVRKYRNSCLKTYLNKWRVTKNWLDIYWWGNGMNWLIKATFCRRWKTTVLLNNVKSFWLMSMHTSESQSYESKLELQELK